MLRKIIALFLALAVLLCAFAGCASKPEVVSSGEASAMVEPAEVPAEEPADMLSGSWTPQGAVYRNTVIDLSDNESLSSMYGGTALTFSEGNTFSYYNMFIYTGTYELYSENIYHLQTKEVTWLSVDENGASEKPMTKADKPAYVVTVLDENTIRFNLSGALAIDDISLIFVRLDSESDYIQANKTPLTSSSESSESNAAPDTSAQNPAYVTTGEKNALKRAGEYLDYTPISYIGLIEQLEYENYTHAEAVYAADNCGADWYEQAAKAAQKYLDYMTFSRSGLIEQLEYEGYTHDEAVYGVDKVY